MLAHQIRQRAALQEALLADRLLLFKHSPLCPVSARAFRAYQSFVAQSPGEPHAWVDVVADRALARWVAASVGVPHASPQALALRAGKVVWHASHDAITPAALKAAVFA